MFYLIDIIFIDILQLETPENQVILETAVNYFPLTMSIAIILGMPIIEELIFRGIFFNYFFTKDTLSQKVIGVIVNALLFGFAHELALTLNLLPYALIGALLAITYLYTKNIYYCILIHITNNAIATWFMLHS